MLLSTVRNEGSILGALELCNSNPGTAALSPNTTSNHNQVPRSAWTETYLPDKVSG